MKMVSRSVAMLPIAAALMFSISMLEDSKPIEPIKPTPAPMTITMDYSTPAPQIAPLPIPDNADVEMLAKLIWGEARSVPTQSEKAAVVWCVLNRVDDPRWPDTVSEVVLQQGQFYGYSPDYPVTEEHEKIAFKVLQSWLSGDDTTRVLPRQYVFFTGDGEHNWFRSEFEGDAICDFKD